MEKWECCLADVTEGTEYAWYLAEIWLFMVTLNARSLHVLVEEYILAMLLKCLSHLFHKDSL